MDTSPRLISTHIQNLMDMYPIVTIAGPRQSGKTTLARHLYPHFDYVSMEDIRRDRLQAKDGRRS
ncbi:MAG: AAA family ATPase [Akkermansia sp.]|nr:AAA family ATPase [Akkermansia sp.]